MRIPELKERNSRSSRSVRSQRTHRNKASNIWTYKSRVVRKRPGECVCKEDCSCI